MSQVELETPESTVEIPPTLPILPLKETVVFPDSVTPLAIGQERSVALVDDVVARDGMLALVSVKDPEVEQPGWDDLYAVGTAATINRLIKVPDGTLRVLVQGIQRVRLDSRIQDEPERIAATWARVSRIMAAVSVPALAGLVVVAPEVLEEGRADVVDGLHGALAAVRIFGRSERLLHSLDGDGTAYEGFRRRGSER
jgi:ATP-dependent Lon protease